MPLVKMNLVMTYPVKWTKYGVLSNYVQNFYDALGIDDFASAFHYQVVSDGDRRTLCMESERSFAREWLYYIGASTKRERKQRTAGGFGEGFKIASLIAFRDYHLDISMASRDWTLRVTTMAGEIDGTECAFLAYDVSSRPYQENAVLRLGNVGETFLEEMESVMEDYYYSGNRRFGRCLAEGDDYAVYEAALSAYDRKQGRTIPRSGSIFASYQCRGSIRVPLIFCNHSYHPVTDDRDRHWLRGGQIETCIRQIAEKLNAEQSWEILKRLRSLWGQTGRNPHSSGPDWREIITVLVRNIRDDTEYPEPKHTFLVQYGNALVIRDTERITPDRSRRMMAMAWYQTSPFQGKLSFVMPAFHELGIRTLCELCEQNDGYTAEREPDGRERQYIRLLQKAAASVLGDVLILDEETWPDCHILLNEKAPVSGYTKVTGTCGRRNRYHLQVRSTASFVYLQSWHFREDGFPQAFVTYCHELLHQFGGDQSVQFHQALLLMDQHIMDHLELMQRYEMKWRMIGKDADPASRTVAAS